ESTSSSQSSPGFGVIIAIIAISLAFIGITHRR
ncbi:PGF-CTERM sorting domain-containing protein, partial [Haloquadratum walsbyi]